MVCPAERRERLVRLGVMNEAGEHFTSLGAAATPPELDRIEKDFVWRRAYLARYLRMPPSEVERIPVAQVRRYMEALKDLLEAESPKSVGAQAEQNFI